MAIQEGLGGGEVGFCTPSPHFKGWRVITKGPLSKSTNNPNNLKSFILVEHAASGMCKSRRFMKHVIWKTYLLRDWADIPTYYTTESM